MSNIHQKNKKPPGIISILSRSLKALALLLIGTSISSSLFAEPASVGSDYVTVGDAGNAPDSHNKGAVSYEFKVAQNDFTYGEFLSVLKAVATNADPHNLWTQNMSAYITRSTGENSTYTYALTKPAQGAYPVCVPLHTVYRIINWYQNGKPCGNEDAGLTETGTYDLRNAQAGQIIAPQANATYRLPTDDEYQKWTYFAPAKSAHAKPSGIFPHYYTYPTQTDAAPDLADPINMPSKPSDQYHTVHYAWAGSALDWYPKHALVSAAAYPNSQGYYGTLSDASNVAQWTTSIDGAILFVRGADWNSTDTSFLQASSTRSSSAAAVAANNYIGFRMVALDNSNANFALSLDNPNRTITCASRTVPAIQDDSIYYQGINHVLYTAKTDGTGEHALLSDLSIQTSPGCCPLLLNNTLYFKRNDAALCKINTDGTSYYWLGFQPATPDTPATDDTPEIPATDAVAGIFTVHNPITDGTSLYLEQNNTLAKVDLDGNNLRTVPNANINSAAAGTIANGWLYYADQNFMLCKVKTTGGQYTQLNVQCIPSNYCSPLVVGDWVYIITPDSKIEKVKTDGTESEFLDANVQTDSLSFPLATDGTDYLYFQGKEDAFLYRIKMDGSAPKEQLDTLGFQVGSSPVFASGYLYCQQLDNNKLFKIAADSVTTTPEVPVTDNPPTSDPSSDPTPSDSPSDGSTSGDDSSGSSSPDNTPQ